MNYWLFKSEPNEFSISDLKNSKNQTSHWEGVRNYQARNYLRDDIKKEDKVLFYHSRVEPMAVVGVAEIVKEAYPDFFSWEPSHKYFDSKSSPEKPIWYMVDVKLITIFNSPVTLKDIKTYKELSNMLLIKKGTRLSIQPVTESEFHFIQKLGNK